MQEIEKMIKRIFDVVSSALALVILAPVFLAIVIAIKADDGGPIFYVQTRMGKNFTPFRLYKFRTMIVDAEKKGAAITIAGDKRVTKTGRLLRKTKLDELPQLVNVLRGEMSIVGPRPEDPKYVEMFKDDYKTILEVKPGITDYATLEYRDEESILEEFEDPEIAYIGIVLPRKIELSKKYIEERTFYGDIILILRTIKAIAMR